MWEYCDPKDHINRERLFTGSEHKKSKELDWLQPAGMWVRQFSINYLGQKVIIFFQELQFGGGLFLCIEGTNSVINTGSPQKNRTQKKLVAHVQLAA